MWLWELREKAGVLWKRHGGEDELLSDGGHKEVGHLLYLVVFPTGQFNSLLIVVKKCEKLLKELL